MTERPPTPRVARITGTQLRQQIHPAEAVPPDDPDHFSGTVRMQSFSETKHNLRAIAVFFEPGGRTRPHTHTHDQLIVCISGEGVVAINRDVERIITNDTVWIPKDTWHWHGAMLPQEAKSRWKGVEIRDWEDYREGG